MINDKSRRAFFAMLHRILVIFDDWLCDTFHYNRKGRGKDVQ